MNKRILAAVIVVVAIAIGGLTYYLVATQASPGRITNFEQCAASGRPVMESYPRQCMADGHNFVEDVPPITVPKPNQRMTQ